MRPQLLPAVLVVIALGCAPPEPPKVVPKVVAEPTEPEFRQLRKGLPTRTPILTYHDVIPERGKGSVWFDCTVREVEEQIAWLKKQKAVFVSLNEVYEGLTGRKTLSKNAVALTFADNYLGFYLYARPILERERIPATMFVHTGFVGSPQGRPKMDWHQLREVDATDLFNVQSQTVSHPADLRDLSESAVLEEFADSKAALEKELGGVRDELAYPNGKWDARVASIAKQAGYRVAFSEVTEPAEASDSILSVNRYVHTKYREAWLEAKNKKPLP